MAQTINPAVGGGRAVWVLDVGIFFLGATMGATATTLLALAAGTILIRAGAEEALRIVAGLGISALVLRELGLRIPVPYRNRQVPEPWRIRMPFYVSTLAYGIVLGTGFATLFVSSAHGAMLLGVASAGSIRLAVASAAAFALGKTFVLLRVTRARTHQDVLDSFPPAERNGLPRIWARRAAGIAASVLAAALIVGGGMR